MCLGMSDKMEGVWILDCGQYSSYMGNEKARGKFIQQEGRISHEYWTWFSEKNRHFKCILLVLLNCWPKTNTMGAKEKRPWDSINEAKQESRNQMCYFPTLYHMLLSENCKWLKPQRSSGGHCHCGGTLGKP